MANDQLPQDIEFKLASAKQDGRLEVAIAIRKILEWKKNIDTLKNEKTLTKEEQIIWELVEDLRKKCGATIEDTGALRPLFKDLTPDAEALKRIAEYEAKGWQLILSGSAYKNDEVGPDKLHEIETQYGKENVTMYMGGAFNLNGETTPLVMIFVKKAALTEKK